MNTLKRVFGPVRPHAFVLIGILIFTIASRLLYLNSIPNGISDDELEFVLNAKAIFYTGYDIAGKWSPFNSSYKMNIFPPLPYVLTALWQGIMPLRNDLARIPYIFSYICLIFILYGITVRLINRNAAIIVGVMAAINPWGIFFSRTSFESPISTMFYMLAFYLVLITKGNFILLTIIPLTMAFFTYTGGKLILLPFSLILFVYAWFVVHKKKYTTQFLVASVAVIILLIYQIVSIRTEAIGSRITEIAQPYSPFITSIVETKRQTSVIGFPSFIFSNRFLSYAEYVFNKYAEAFSPKLLYMTGDIRSTYSMSYHGYFYLFDMFFFPIGMYFLFRYKRRIFSLLSCLLIIAPLPAVLGTVDTGFIALRGALLFPIMIMIHGIGLYFLLTKKHTIMYRITIWVIACIYIISFFNFIYMYFYRYGVYSSEAYGFSRRILGNYIRLASPHTPLTIVTGDPDSLLKHYLFVSNGYNRTNAMNIRAVLGKPVISIANMTIIQCDTVMDLSPKNTIIIETGRCEKKYAPPLDTHDSIPILSDGGEIFKIYGDALCASFPKKRYPSDIRIEDFNIQELSTERFCTQFITHPSN